MSVMLIDETNRDAFSTYLPGDMFQALAAPETVALCAVDDKTDVAAGLVVAHVSGGQTEIIWLFVAEPYRERGLAHELLHAVVTASFGKVQAVTAAFDAENRELSNLFRRHCFAISREDCPVYSLSVEMIKRNPFFNRSARSLEVIPVGEVPAYTMSAFMKHLDSISAGIAIELPPDPALYDMGLSMAYIRDREIRGILLFTPQDDGYDLSLAYVMPGEKTALAAMLQSAGRILIETHRPEVRISAAALNTAAAAIIERLFPELARMKRFRASYIFV